MADADIGLIGLGVMGGNLALNMADHGFRVAVYNRTRARTDAFLERAGALRDRIVDTDSPQALAAAVKPPRPIVIMVEAGPAVDETIAVLGATLSPGDVVIDAGNANFHDTRRRAAETTGKGHLYLGLGVSGGEEGARYGPSMMAGGDRAAFERVEAILMAIAADYKGAPCAAYLGSDGAGHFVKTIHNGIEYSDMQMIAEIYGVMRDGLGMAAADMGSVFARWNEGPLDSYLIEITGKVLAEPDPETGWPMVNVILDRAGQKGTGRWAAIEAQTLGVPATTIEAAVAARALSARKDERVTQAEQYGFAVKPMGDALGDPEAAYTRMENALLVAKVAAYAQGFAVMTEASAVYGWNLPMMTIARIWRAGCIIRSQFLDTIASGFEKSGDQTPLTAMPYFATIIDDAEADLRAVVLAATQAGVPVPALSAALAYLDGIRTANGTANLIQAQRDFFGAHGFERNDREGKGFHGPWGMTD